MTDLFSSVIAAHGGLDRWRTVRAIDVTFNFSGGLLDLKGYPGHHRPSASVDAATPRTVFQRLGDESDDRWIFTPNRVWRESKKEKWWIQQAIISESIRYSRPRPRTTIGSIVWSQSA